MNLGKTALKTIVLLSILIGFASCESTDEGSVNVSGSVYYGTSLYDPWYYGDYYYPPDVIVTPPDLPDRPIDARPSHPIALPPTPRPTPMPSIPAMPRVSPRR